MTTENMLPNLGQLHTYFLANISHEFRTPLSSLTASLEILLGELDQLDRAELRQLLQSMQMSAISLRMLVDNLLESTSIEAGRFSIVRQPVQINPILASAIQVVQPLLDRREQWLVLTSPFSLPTIQVDPLRLGQVFINLLTNASKYSPFGQKIDIGLDVLDRNLLIAIADRGPGIPEEGAVDLFQPFSRLAVSHGEQYGTGLGLSVVRSIVEGHGGTISLDPRPGGGSIFWITLPLGKDTA